MQINQAITENEYNLTHSNTANQIIEEWRQAVAKDVSLNNWNEHIKKNPLKYAITPKQNESQMAGIKKRVDKAIGMLIGQGLIDKNSLVLDLGCGTGSYALPLSGIVKRVDAVDISNPMIDYMNEKIKKNKINNIRVIQEDWMEFSRKKSDSCYHLVISSLNPGMYNGRAILEMTRLSRRACLFSSPYKYAYSSVICYLDKIMLGARERPEINCRSIIYPFNILYYLGYRPQLEYMDGTCTIRESPEEAIERLVKRYEELIDINDEIRKKIRDFIYNRQDNGVFKQKISSFIGLLIWKVNTVSNK